MMQDALSSTEPGEHLLAASAPYVGQWQRLVSTTNWQKGRIIGQWRESLAAQGVPAAECSDEAWARLVGGVSGQHAGRLRRVYARFGAVHEQYADLFWSHFHAALDWDDAEMWLQGASSSGWSVARMREQRWETLGRIESERPREEVVAGDVDEDAETIADCGLRIADSERSSHGSADASPSRTDASPSVAELRVPRAEDNDEEDTAGQASSGTRAPFADLPELPDDLAEALETMKLAILRHKTQGWRQVGAADVLRMLDTLKELAVAAG